MEPMAQAFLEAVNSKGRPQRRAATQGRGQQRRETTLFYKAKNSVAAVSLQIGLTIVEASGYTIWQKQALQKPPPGVIVP